MPITFATIRRSPSYFRHRCQYQARNGDWYLVPARFHLSPGACLMPQFLDDLLVTTSLRMQRFTLDPGDTRFTACFTVEAGPLRLVKEFDFSDHPDASGSLRRLA